MTVCVLFRQTMKSMGLYTKINFLAWFVSSFVTMAVLSIVIVLFLIVGEVYEHSDWGVMIVFMLDYSFATLMLRSVLVRHAHAEVSIRSPPSCSG